jgi:MarR family transcriptional regulator, organic hydroperoxide resistance regulator
MAESGLTDHAGYWLRRLSDEVHHSFERQLAGHEVTVAQWNVLVTVYHGQATTTAEAARLIGIDPVAVSRLVDRLAAKGLMTRRADLASRRSLRLSLTGAGRALVPVLIRIADANDAAYFGVLPPAQRKALVQLLRQLLPPAPPATTVTEPCDD